MKKKQTFDCIAILASKNEHVLFSSNHKELICLSDHQERQTAETKIFNIKSKKIFENLHLSHNNCYVCKWISFSKCYNYYGTKVVITELEYLFFFF